MKRSPLNPVSAKRRAQAPQRRALRERVLSDTPLCVANITDLCGHVATDVHEVKTRGRGGSILDDANCIALCRPCHSFITTNPEWATTNGFMVHAWDHDMNEAAELRRQWAHGGRRN